MKLKQIFSIFICVVMCFGSRGYAASANNTLNLTVEQNIIKNVKRETYGINFEWGGNPSTYFVDGTTQINPLFVERFNDNIPIARMAGVSSNWMLWKQAIGDISERGDLFFWHYNKRPQYLGPIEWINMVRSADSDVKLIYTVNMPRQKPTDERIVGLIGKKIDQIDTLENLKDLVRFMTLTPDDPKAVGSDGINWAQRRVDLGITKPVEIFAWELGCELDADGQGWYRVAEYIEMCEPAIEAIREIDPDAKISAHEKTNIFFSEDITRKWHKQLLNAIGDKIDYLSLHYYYYPDEWDKFEDYLDKLQSDIALTPAKDRIKILLTEHSSKRYSEETNAGYDYDIPHTMRGTLSTAEFLTEIMYRPEIVAGMYHSVNSSSWSLMYSENGKYHRTAPGFILEMFGQKGVGSSLKHTLVAQEEFADSDKVKAGAIKTTNGLNLFLVNTSNETDVKINFNLGNTYTLLKETIVTAESYESDKFIGVDEIDFIENSKKEVISSYNLPARSVVLLEFGNNVSITTVLSNGNVYYTARLMAPVNCDLVCGAYKGDVLLNAKRITKSLAAGNTSSTINMGGKLTGADNLRLFVWESGTLSPVCDVEKYSLNK